MKSSQRTHLITHLALVGLVTLVFLLATSCGYIYTSQVQGYIIDSEDDGGINGATVYIYNAKPGFTINQGDADKGLLTSDPAFVTTRGTSTQNNQAGFYSSRVLWDNSLGKFGPEGDSASLWFYVSHEDYTSTIVEVQGILSGTTNSLQDISLVRNTLEVEEVRGRLLNASGEGVNGVRIVLNKDQADIESEDYVTTTQTLDGLQGSFLFTNVRWKSADPTVTTTTMGLRIDDDAWRHQEVEGKVEPVALEDGLNKTIDNITITRKPRTEFSTNINGRLVQERIISGVGSDQKGLIINYTIVVDGNGDGILGETSDIIIYGTTNNNGDFAATINWSDDDNSDDNEKGLSIPEGEDLVTWKIVFETNFSSAPTSLEFDGIGSIPESADTVTIESATVVSGVQSTEFPDARSWQNLNLPTGVRDLGVVATP